MQASITKPSTADLVSTVPTLTAPVLDPFGLRALIADKRASQVDGWGVIVGDWRITATAADDGETHMPDALISRTASSGVQPALTNLTAVVRRLNRVKSSGESFRT